MGENYGVKDLTQFCIRFVNRSVCLLQSDNATTTEDSALENDNNDDEFITEEVVLDDPCDQFVNGIRDPQPENNEDDSIKEN